MILPASLCGLQGEVKINTRTNLLSKPTLSSRISLAALPESKNNVGGWNKSNPLRARPTATVVAAEVAESSLDITSSLDEPFDEPALSTIDLEGIQVGDTVSGKVIYATDKFARVVLLDNPNIVGYMPAKEGPFSIRETGEGPPRDSHRWCIPKGLIREFQVLAVPDKEENRAAIAAATAAAAAGEKPQHQHPRGPLLSAKALDMDIMWHRFEQICDIASSECRENIKLSVESTNSGGLISRLGGVPLFVPVSHLSKKSNGEWWSKEEMVEFKGKDITIALIEVSRNAKKIVGSISRARENEILRRVDVGSLVKGTVRRIESFGVFIGIDGTKHSGLLHISNMSRQHVDRADAVFRMGEKVNCLVLGMDPDYSNMSLSTAELEPEDGMLLRDKEAVWAAAEEQTELFQEHLKTLKEDGFDFEGFYHQSMDEGRPFP